MQSLVEGHRTRAEEAWTRCLRARKESAIKSLTSLTVDKLVDAGMNLKDARLVVEWAEEQECELATALEAWARS